MPGLLSHVPTVVSPRMRAGTPSPLSDFWYTPEGWMLPLEDAGIEVTPELALTLSYVYCAVDTISGDFGTMPCQLYEDLGDEGRRRVRFGDPGIGGLAYRLQWQPNQFQTAKAFWSTLAWQYLLRPACYAEQVYREGTGTFLDQLIPRHPDRVHQERLATGALRFRLTEPDGTFRYVSEDEMFVVRNTSTDGLNAIGRTRYAAKALSTGLSLMTFTRNYFRKGATAALLATYKGDLKEEDDETALHGTITRYLSGVENAGGVLLVPEDLAVTSLGVEPQKAELLGLKNHSGRDVARMFKMPPSWLAIEGAAAYASQVQDAENYKNRCQTPMVVEFEQAIKLHLIIQKMRFFAKFNMDYLVRGDLKTRMEAYEIGVRSRVIWPSEARVREDMNPDERLDKLAEGDNRPGTPAAKSTQPGAPGNIMTASPRNSRAELRQLLILHDAAVRCVRRERVAVEKIAKKYPADVERWQAELKEFYADHANFVASTMRLPLGVARAYAATHGAALEEQGVVLMSDHWERTEAEELAAIALDPIVIAA